jgi:large subunit ribosomal protein L32
MAVPKKKVSHSRKMKRRSSVWKLEQPTNIVKCPQCGEPILAHRVCKACGYYKGEQVVAVADGAEK